MTKENNFSEIASTVQVNSGNAAVRIIICPAVDSVEPVISCCRVPII
jgi:hypothetical protein